MRAKRPSRNAGFTLVELLVAAALGALLAAIAAQFGARVTDSFARAAGRLAAAREARVALDQIGRDFSSAWFRDDGNVWLAADLIADPALGLEDLWVSAPVNGRPLATVTATADGPMEDSRFGGAGVWLRFFTTANVTDPTAFAAAPVAVGYRIVRRTRTNGTPAGYQLCRFATRPAGDGVADGVLESGYNLTAPAYSEGSPAWRMTPGDPTESSFVLADDVVDFGVRCFVYDRGSPDGQRLIFPQASGAASNALRASRRRVSAPITGEADEFPDVIEVAVRILTPEGVQLISAWEAGRLPQTPVAADDEWWRLVLAHSRVHVRRIVIHAA